MEPQITDFILVVSGLCVFIGYHIWLLYQIVNNPARTIIGNNAIQTRLWANARLEDPTTNASIILQGMSSHTTAPGMLATAAFALSTLMVVFYKIADSPIQDGDKLLGFSVPFFIIMIALFVSFFLQIHSVRTFNKASTLISVLPVSSAAAAAARAERVGRTVIKGDYYYCVGLRALYLSVPLALLVFGAIPMFVSCVLIPIPLYFWDFEFGMTDAANGAPAPVDEEEFVDAVEELEVISE